MLAGKSISTKFIYNALESEVEISNILMTDSVSTIKVLKRRIKRLGFTKVFIQLLLKLLFVRLLKIFSSRKHVQRQAELELNGASLL